MELNIGCRFFGLHTYVVYKEENFTDVKGNVIGKVIINRCTKCGKISKTKVFTESGHER